VVVFVSDRNQTTLLENLLAVADEVIAMAKELQYQGRHADAVAFALFANEYVRAARAMQAMEEATHAWGGEVK
jgi:hypothetical protein